MGENSGLFASDVLPLDRTNGDISKLGWDFYKKY